MFANDEISIQVSKLTLFLILDIVLPCMIILYLILKVLFIKKIVIAFHYNVYLNCFAIIITFMSRSFMKNLCDVSLVL